MGPAIWQGVMLILMLPAMALFYWAWQKEPIYPQTDAERQLGKKWARRRNAVWITYVVFGIVLFVVLIAKGV